MSTRTRARLRAEARAALALPEGAEIRRLRDQAGLAQDWLAEFCGVGKACVSKWERGASRPRGDHLLRLAEALAILRGDAA